MSLGKANQNIDVSLLWPGSIPPPSSWLYDVSIRLWRQKWDEQHFTQKTCPRDQPPSPFFAEGFSQKQWVSGVPGWVHETTSFRSQSLASPNQHIESSSELVVKVFPTTPWKRDRNFPKSEWLRYIEYPFAANMWGWRGYVRLCPISGVSSFIFIGLCCLSILWFVVRALKTHAGPCNFLRSAWCLQPRCEVVKNAEAIGWNVFFSPSGIYCWGLKLKTLMEFCAQVTRLEWWCGLPADDVPRL